jgi:hypothetical protein
MAAGFLLQVVPPAVGHPVGDPVDTSPSLTQLAFEVGASQPSRSQTQPKAFTVASVADPWGNLWHNSHFDGGPDVCSIPATADCL